MAQKSSEMVLSYHKCTGVLYVVSYPLISAWIITPRCYYLGKIGTIFGDKIALGIS